MIDFNKPLRRGDKEIKDLSIIHSILNKALVCHLALSYNDTPYIIPLNFVFDENLGCHGVIYLHSAREGLKLDIITKNNQVCLEVEDSVELVTSSKPCNWGMKYKSVVTFGKIFVEEDIDEKQKAMDFFMDKYSAGTELEAEKFDYENSALDSVCLLKIEISKITGKKSGF